LSADLSTLFDVGGILGAIAAGYLSDVSGMSATVCTGMLFIASPIVSPPNKEHQSIVAHTII